MKNRIKHAIYYDNRFGRNDGSPLYYFNVMKNQLKLDVVHLIPIGDTQKQFGNFDFHWWVDWGEDALSQMGLVNLSWKIPKDGGKTIYVASDTHIDNGYRLNKAKEFDYVFLNQKRALEDFLKILQKDKLRQADELPPYESIWLPHAAEPKAYPKFEILKKWDICFIGHVQETPNEFFHNLTRVDVLDRAFKEFPNFYYGSRDGGHLGINMFEDASKKFSQSKIVLNYSIKDDVNMRVFEAMSSGSMLLTNWLPTLEDLFEDGKHLVTYKTLDEMVEKAKYYIEHDKEREKIAAAGHREFMAKHTYRKRIEKILEVIKGQK